MNGFGDEWPCWHDWHEANTQDLSRLGSAAVVPIYCCRMLPLLLVEMDRSVDVSARN